MRISLDTEFYEDGKTIELISIGMVNEWGDEYYAEVIGAGELAQSTPWLAENVYPHLTGNRKSKSQIAHEVVWFAGDEPEFWAWYGSYDWVVLCQLYGRMIDKPPTWPMFIRDLRQTLWAAGSDIPQLVTTGEGLHNALSDARWLHRALAQFDEEQADKNRAWQMFENWRASSKALNAS